MSRKALFEILKPLYSPCVHFKNACAGHCQWSLDIGMVPSGFGGATGELSEVKLIVITAEPGAPIVNHGYSGTPQEMVENSMKIFERSLRVGGVDRASGFNGRFHRNFRRILEYCWPEEGIDAILRKTWVTNTVLCPLPPFANSHPKQVKTTCGNSYLKQQIELFPSAFILVLGRETKARMEMNGFEYNANGLHPSYWANPKASIDSWKLAAAELHAHMNR